LENCVRKCEIFFIQQTFKIWSICKNNNWENNNNKHSLHKKIICTIRDDDSLELV
jgi:hypothetical protein